MSASVIPFVYENKPVRAVDREGEPWFVGRDVCDVLSIKNSRDALARLDDDEKGVANADTLGGEQEVTIVSEPGVYRLVFTSRRPQAEAFKRWLAHEVVPQLRKTGRFAPPEPPSPAPGTTEALALNNWRLAAIKEARLLFGPARAAQLWGELGLPSVPAAPQALAGLGAAGECLSVLLDWRGFRGEGSRLGDVLRMALAIGAPNEIDDLRALGIRLAEEEPLGVIVANYSQALSRIYWDTRWRECRWKDALRLLPGAHPTGPMRFGLDTQRGVFIPEALLADEKP
jgi:prophage antirepressor-like protein